MFELTLQTRDRLFDRPLLDLELRVEGLGMKWGKAPTPPLSFLLTVAHLLYANFFLSLRMKMR